MANSDEVAEVPEDWPDRPPMRKAAIVVVLGVAVGAAVLLMADGARLITATVLVAGILICPVAVVRPDLLMTFLFATSGTALAGTWLGREALLDMGGALNASSFGLLLALCVLLLSLFLHTGWLSRGLGPVLPHALFVGYAALSILWTPSTVLGLREWSKLLFPLVVVVAAYSVWKRKPRPWMFHLMYWAGLLIVLTGPFVYRAGNPGIVEWAGEYALYSGSWGVSTYMFGAYTALLAIYALVRCHAERRVWFLGVALMFALNTLVTGVRSAIFPLFFVGGVYFYLRSRNPLRGGYLVGAFVALVVAATVVPWLSARTFGSQVPPTLETLVVQPSSVLDEGVIRWTRSRVWGVATAGFLASPFVGGGIGAARWELTGGSIRGGSTGGEYIGVLGDLGIVGLVLFALTFFAYALCFKRDFESRRRQPGGGYSLLALLWLLFFAGYCFAYDGFDTWSISFLVFAATGIALAEMQMRWKAPSVRNRTVNHHPEA